MRPLACMVGAWLEPPTPPIPAPLRSSTVLMFPSELGGASLSSAAYQRLQQCPVADPPCADQQVGAGCAGGCGLRPSGCTGAAQLHDVPLHPCLQSSTVFGTLGPAVVPASSGQNMSCLSGKYERDCATACASTSGCAGFLYTAQGSSSGACGRVVCTGMLQRRLIFPQPRLAAVSHARRLLLPQDRHRAVVGCFPAG